MVSAEGRLTAKRVLRMMKPDEKRKSLRRRIMFLVIFGSLIGVLIVGLFVLSLTSSRPDALGAKNGTLADCPDSPNCVSSQSKDQNHRVEPISINGSPDEAVAKMEILLNSMPRTRVVERSPRYLRAEVTSRLFRFTDDLELLLEPEAKVFQVRSASRVGRWDLGANRKRVEKIRQRFCLDN